jgi:outer membrane protein assembly factor BamB
MRRLLHTLFACAAVVLLSGADWPQFRGARGTSVAEEETLPTQLGSSVAYSVELPGRGLSGPIVVGDYVFLTASSGFLQDRLHVLCFRAADGRQVWHRQFWATGRTLCHPKMCNATPTPASDGERIFAFYSSNDLACLDLQGNLQWFRGLTHDYQNASNSLGMASSPLICNDTLVVQAENLSESIAVGIDVQTGENRWKKNRPPAANWTSSVPLPRGNGAPLAAVLQTASGLVAVEPRTGDEIWRYDQSCATIPSLTVAGGALFVPSAGITRLEPAAAGGPPRVAWQSGKLNPNTPSPVVYDGKVYAIGGAGVLTCADAADGKVLWQLRLQVQLGDRTIAGEFTSTPVAAGGHLYLFNEQGVAVVVNVAGGRGEVVSTHDFSETILASPAAANGALYVRSDKHLWKIGGRSP